MKNRIKVMIVEDSAVVRELLRHIIGGDPRFDIVAAVGSAEEALQCLEAVAPDVITLDIRLPKMNGLDATLQIMARRPTPIVVVSAHVESDELNIAMNALRAGALTVVEKPVGVSSDDYDTIADDLRNQLEIMSQVKVVRQMRRRDLCFGTGPLAAGAPHVPEPAPVDPDVVAVVASTGGPNALSVVLSGLGEDFPRPILLVQHITPTFNDGFAAWLREVSGVPVSIARSGERPRAGHAYLPPADHHLLYRGGRMWVDDSPAVANQRPSGTVLFTSIAEELRARALGVLLTGMGSDGAEGLLAMRRAGAYTIAEDASTAVIFGMPAAAIKMGGATETLPLPAIAPRIRQLMGVEA